ncbi:hypothetical protein DVH05_025173 [Phytophthora capsici]|nr:hypothetical protein DVH05_025173 [Phytophthora capsici]
MAPWRLQMLLGCLLLLILRETQATNAHYSIDLTGIASGTAYTLTVDIGSGSSTGSVRDIFHR